MIQDLPKGSPDHTPIKTSLTTIILNKPYGYLSQFTLESSCRWQCLKPLVPITNVYAAGRLDADSEGLLLLTSNGKLQQRLTNPTYGHWRHYWVQVEGEPNQEQLKALRQGLIVKGRVTRPAQVKWLDASFSKSIPERYPPIRFRKAIPTNWLDVAIQEGRNRQVRKMTAAVGLPTLRLIRHQIDLMDKQPPLTLKGLPKGHWRELSQDEGKRIKALLNQ